MTASLAQTPVAAWRHAAKVPLARTELAPIATCHWQWVGNVFEAWGHDDAWRQLGLSWGCRWHGGPVLWGLASWPELLRRASGAEVSIRTYDDATAARRAELDLSAAERLFVVEVDAHHVPGPRVRDHAVHAVLVLERHAGGALIVDATIGPDAIACSDAHYELLRESPCRRRIEPRKLYAIERGPLRPPAPDVLLAVVREHLAATLSASLDALARFTAAVERSDDPADVCRAAGERFQAARLFEHLSAQGVPEAEPAAELLDELARQWYLVHLLTDHTGSAGSRQRARIVRLLKQLADAEAAAACAVLR